MTAPPPPEHPPAAQSEVAPAQRPPAPAWWRRRGVLLAAAGIVVLGVAAAVLLPRLLDRGPYAAAGPDGSPGHQLASELSESMTCTAGEIGKDRSVLACYHQDDHLVEIVFAQTDPEGRVASYTAETHLLVADPDAPTDDHGHAHGDSDATIALANEVADVVTPGANFDDCAYDRSTPYYCFAEVAEWRAESPSPIETTGAARHLPDPAAVAERLGESGWSCDPLGCTHGEASVAAQEGTTGLVLQFAAPVQPELLTPAANAVLADVPDTEELAEWANGLDGTVDIVVADGLVAGFVPMSSGGIVVIEEVAGVIAGST